MAYDESDGFRFGLANNMRSLVPPVAAMQEFMSDFIDQYGEVGRPGAGSGSILILRADDIPLAGAWCGRIREVMFCLATNSCKPSV